MFSISSHFEPDITKYSIVCFWNCLAYCPWCFKSYTCKYLPKCNLYQKSLIKDTCKVLRTFDTCQWCFLWHYHSSSLGGIKVLCSCSTPAYGCLAKPICQFPPLPFMNIFHLPAWNKITIMTAWCRESTRARGESCLLGNQKKIAAHFCCFSGSTGVEEVCRVSRTHVEISNIMPISCLIKRL